MVEHAIMGDMKTFVDLAFAIHALAALRLAHQFRKAVFEDAAVKTALWARLDALAAQLPPGGNHDLRHYLQRKSYEKARLWLEGVDPEKGTCRR